MKRLEGKVAVVTGGAGGIGVASARKLVSEGARVLLLDLEEGALREAARAIGSEAATIVTGDVSKPEDNERMIRTAVERHGGVDILVANAGIEGTVKPIPEFPVETFDKVLAVNVRGVWLGMKYAIPEIAKRGGGSIVILSSIAGLHGFAGLSQHQPRSASTISDIVLPEPRSFTGRRRPAPRGFFPFQRAMPARVASSTPM